MTSSDFTFLTNLRLAVGRLGERSESVWWPSQFFGHTSSAFLEPVFSRTLPLARYHGVLQAAARKHDEHIGVGRVYHLFRLPEDIEHGIHLAIQGGMEGLLSDLIDLKPVLEWLRQAAARVAVSPGEGAVRIGDARLATTSEPWPTVAAHYLLAFEHGTRTFPYFAEVR